MGGEPERENPTTAMKVNAGSSNFLSTLLQTSRWDTRHGQLGSSGNEIFSRHGGSSEVVLTLLNTTPPALSNLFAILVTRAEQFSFCKHRSLSHVHG